MTEHEEQVMLFARATAFEHIYPELRLLHAIPNGGERNVIVGAKMKREGVRRGVPDVHLPISRGGWLSLYIEMKRLAPRVTKTKGVRMDKTKPSPAQREWMDALTKAGNLCVVCHTAEEAWDAITGYLAGRMERAA